MLEFMAAVYNEEYNILALIESIYPWVDKINLCDDGSTDRTLEFIREVIYQEGLMQYSKVAAPTVIAHTGLPEVVKAEALKMCQPDSWVVMLDCDERISTPYWYKIQNFLNSEESEHITHVWFRLEEFIDGSHMKNFQKCRLFRANAAHFSDSLHVDDSFDGQGAYYGWVVTHSKTSEKQIKREHEYIDTYKKLVAEGKMTPERMREVIGYHYFVKE